MNVWVRVAMVLHVAGLLAALLLVASAHVSDEEHAEYSRVLSKSRELDARWNQEVAKLRLRVVAHYDNLVHLRDEIAQVEAQLERMPGFVRTTEGHDLARQVERYRQAVVEKDELVETLKSEEAVLWNSVQAFPHGVQALLMTLGDAEEHEAVRDLLLELEGDVMRYSMIHSRRNESATRCSLGRLVPGDVSAPKGCGQGPVALAAAYRPAAETLARHASIILERYPIVERLVSQIVGHPLSSRAAELNETYATIHRRATSTLLNRWSIVWILSTGLLACVSIDIILRLRRSALRERELARLKTHFVSMTSHEFRTPLSVILSSSELLEAYRAQWPPEKTDRHLHRIRDSARGMARMLDEVLLIGRAEAGMLELNPAPLRLSSFCDDLVEEMRAVHPGRTLDYENRLTAEEVWMDVKLVRLVLTNLLSNAFKYSSSASVVRFEVRQFGDGATFHVQDRGIGIPAEDQARLFEAFHRAQNTVGIPGTGLGLAVVKKALDVQRGTIAVESRLGEGTRFEARIPFSGGVR